MKLKITRIQSKTMIKMKVALRTVSSYDVFNFEQQEIKHDVAFHDLQSKVFFTHTLQLKG